MSFDLFFHGFRHGEAAAVDPALLEAAFGRYARSRDATCWMLAYPDGSSTELYLDLEAGPDHFMVARPPSDPAFWRGLFDILSKTQGVVFWPGGGCVVADPRAVPHLPADMIEALGAPVVAAEPGDILATIVRS